LVGTYLTSLFVTLLHYLSI